MLAVVQIEIDGVVVGMAAFKNIVLLSCKYRILAKTPLNSIRFKHDENFSVKSLLNSQLIGSDVCVQVII